MDATAEGQPYAIRPVLARAARVQTDLDARVLAEHLGHAKAEAEAPAAPAAKLVAGDMCPECGQATFVYEEGCKKCYGCGFNEC